LKVRGAPAIAIVGCLSLAVEINPEDFENKKSLRQEIEGKLNYYDRQRPRPFWNERYCIEQTNN